MTIPTIPTIQLNVDGQEEFQIKSRVMDGTPSDCFYCCGHGVATAKLIAIWTIRSLDDRKLPTSDVIRLAAIFRDLIMPINGRGVCGLESCHARYQKDINDFFAINREGVAVVFDGLAGSPALAS